MSVVTTHMLEGGCGAEFYINQHSWIQVDQKSHNQLFYVKMYVLEHCAITYFNDWGFLGICAH